MKTKKIIIMMGISALIMTSGIAVYAGQGFSPVERLSELTATPVETLYEEKGDLTFGELASQKGVIEEFRKDMLENKKNILEQRVTDKRLAQEEADAIYSKLLEKREDCDGSGFQRNEEKLGLGFGTGNGMGNGEKISRGQGFGAKKQENRNQRF